MSSANAQPTRSSLERRRPPRRLGWAATLSIGLHAVVLAGASVLLAGGEIVRQREDMTIVRLDLRHERVERAPPVLPLEVRPPIPRFQETVLVATEPLDREAWSGIERASDDEPTAGPKHRDTQLSPEQGARRGSVRAKRPTTPDDIALVAGVSVGADASGAGPADAGSGTPTGSGKGSSSGGDPDGTGPGSGGRAIARAIEMPRPVYPVASRRRGEEGLVSCRIHVRADGTVESVEVLASSGSYHLDRAAVAALEQWRFEPALRHGEPIESLVDQEVRFQLHG